MPDQTADDRPGPDASPAVLPFPTARKRAPAQDRILEAVLAVSGERGYETIAVSDVLERAEVSRATFYKYFEDKEDCFVQAHRDACEWLHTRLVSVAKRQPSWREGLRAAMADFLDFCANQPAVAKAIVVEVHAAGPRAMAQREDLMERLSRAVDGARREIPTRQAPPPVTSTFIVGAIDALVSAKLMDDDAARAPEMLPGLLYFVVRQYFDEKTAWEEMAAAPLAQWDARRGAAGELPER